MIGNSSLLKQHALYHYTLLCPTDHEGTTKEMNATTTTNIDLTYQGLVGGNTFSYSPFQPLQFQSQVMDVLREEKPEEPLLVVVNIGAHYHNTSLYETDVDYIVNTFQELDNPSNLYFFRTTIPGHLRCLPRRPKKPRMMRFGAREFPYQSYEEYANVTASVGPDSYHWYLFEDYNEYVKRKVGSVLHVLDVFNMTVLRRDGHGGGGDCLHYRPGPGDWWNHLLLTQLTLISPNSTALRARLDSNSSTLFSN